MYVLYNMLKFVKKDLSTVLRCSVARICHILNKSIIFSLKITISIKLLPQILLYLFLIVIQKYYTYF